MAVHISQRVQLSVVLLGLMLIAGSFSAFGGYFFGRESLRGVTQPVVNPILGDVTSNSEDLGQRQAFLKEPEIIAQVERITSNKPETAASPAPEASAKPETPPQSPTIAGLPLTTTEQGVQLRVDSVQVKDNNLVLGVSLQNKSLSSLQFIYTFLDITSDEGTPLIAITQGLPSELPAESDAFQGTIQIPLASLDEVKSLNLSLADFPNQDVTLTIKNIPAQP